MTLHVARAKFATGQAEEAVTWFTQTLDSLHAIAAHGDTLEVQYLIAACEVGMGLIEAQRATAGAAGAARLGHWRAAHDWFASSLPRYQRLLKTVTIPPQDERGYQQALAGLARSAEEIARIEGVAPASG